MTGQPDNSRWTRIDWCLLAVVLLLFARAAWVNVQDLREFPGIDLRNRVVGARTLLAGHSPYSYRWQKGDPVELLDPMHDPLPRFTISPAELAFFLPFASWPYGTQRWLYALLEAAALVTTLILLLRWLESRPLRLWFLLVAGVFFLNGEMWRFHVERGQVYVFHLLLLTLSFRELDHGDLNSTRAGCLLGLLMLFRPTFVVAIPPLLLLRRWRTLRGVGIVLAGGLAATALLMPNASWREYLGMGEAWFRMQWQPESLPEEIVPDHAGTVEGYLFAHHLRGILPNSLSNLFWLGRMVSDVPVFDWGRLSKGALAVVVLAFYANLWFSRRGQRATLAFLACLLLSTELFLPVRWPYVDVQLLLPLALCFPWLVQTRSGQVFGAILLATFLATWWLPVFTSNQALLEANPIPYQLAPVARPWIVLAGLSWLAGMKCWTRNVTGSETPASGP